MELTEHGKRRTELLMEALLLSSGERRSTGQHACC